MCNCKHPSMTEQNLEVEAAVSASEAISHLHIPTTIPIPTLQDDNDLRVNEPKLKVRDNGLRPSKPKFLSNMPMKKVRSKAVKGTSSYEADILFTFTSLTRWFLAIFSDASKRIKSSAVYKILCQTTQPLHAIAVILVFLVAMIFVPVDRKLGNFLSVKFTYLTYFLAFSLHIGSQFWMTFVSGLSLYFNLARHAFGDVQKILFPRYFAMNCVLSAITFVQFSRLHASSIFDGDLQTLLQLVSLTLCFLVEFYIRVKVVPSVLQLISLKTVIEKSAGIGEEVGHYELGPLLKCPHYLAIHKAFRRVHMLTAMGNILAIMCSAFHLYYLAYKWTVVLPVI